MAILPKGTPLDEMIRAIKKVHAGSRYFSHDVAEQLAETVLGEQKSRPLMPHLSVKTGCHDGC